MNNKTYIGRYFLWTFTLDQSSESQENLERIRRFLQFSNNGFWTREIKIDYFTHFSKTTAFLAKTFKGEFFIMICYNECLGNKTIGICLQYTNPNFEN